jgi:putative membrane-bound dehydrogenase-like protein
MNLRLARYVLLLTAHALFAADAPPADVVPFAGLDAQEAAAKATLPPGFKLHVFAAEPDVIQPISFCLDDRGRVWVAEGISYPRRRGAPPKDDRPAGADRTQPTPEQLKDIFGGLDRVLVFEDTNGDHKFDKRTVFLENVNLISGMELGFGGVWIGAAPYLLFVPVGDWDNPKPAGDPQILLDGWDYLRDTHETLNTFRWGPDGWLYGCHGVFCPSHVGKPGAPESERQWMDCGVWRYHPTRQVFEVFAEGGSNPWGIDFDEYGQCWQEACVIPHLFHMIQGGRYQRQGGEHFTVGREETARYAKHRDPNSRKPRHPHIYEDIQQSGDHVHWAGNLGPHAANARSDAAGGGHAHAGLMCYLGDSWPAEYRGKLFIGNIHGQRLNMDIPVRRGSGWVGRHGKDFLNFNDTWSQTLDQRYDQDGSVFLIDWYDKNQCHHGRDDGHDKSNGRIYKIVYADTKMTQVDLQTKSDEELVARQLHKNDWHVRHARRILQERAARNGPSANVREALTTILRENPDSTRRLRALWALHVTSGLDARTAIANVRSPDEWVRAWTIQLVSESRQSIERVLREIDEQGLTADPDLNEMAESDPSPVVRLYLAAAAQRLPEAVRADVVRRLLQRSEDAGDHNLPLMLWYALEPLVADHPLEALQAALETKLPKILNFTARRIAAEGTPAARDLLAEALGRLNDPAKQLDLLRGLSAALRGQRSVPMPKGWDAIESKLGGSSHGEVRMLTQQLSLTFGSQAALMAMRKTVEDPSAEAGARRAALDSLLAARDSEAPSLLLRLLNDSALRGGALRSLAAFDHPQTPQAILAIYGTLAAGEKRDALSTLASRAAFAKPLLAAIVADKIPKSDLSAEVIRQLRNLRDADLAQQLTKVYGTVREPSADKQREIERYKRVYWAGGSQPGDGPRGRLVYDKVCAQCHTLFDEGGKVGPDLTGSNRGDIDYILQNVLDPNAVIPNDYRAWNLETKDGRSITGLLKQQDDKAVTIVTQNETLTIPRKEIESLEQSELSMMPEDLITQLTDQEVRDLIYYLSRPGQVPPPVEAAGK